MQASDLALLSSWQNFHVIIGTAAATLTGLMFLAITLLAGHDTQADTMNMAISAFNAPTVVHFCAALLLASIFSAPWPSFSSLAVALGLLGLGIVVYLLNIVRWIRRIANRQTPLKDWVWYLWLPLCAYIALIAGAMVLPAYPALALYMVSAVMLALIFLGIHNAWDLVTFLAIERSKAQSKSRAEGGDGTPAAETTRHRNKKAAR